MNRLVIALLIWLSAAGAFAQDATAIAAQREAEERDRRVTSLLDRLQEANNVQQRRIVELNNELTSVRRQLTELETRFKNSQLGAASQSDLHKAYDKMAEIEKARQADNNLVKEQFGELKKLLSQPQPPIIITQAPPPFRAPRDRGDRDQDKDRSEEKTNDRTATRADISAPNAPEFNGEYYTYKIKSGDRLLAVIAQFNAELKEKGKAPITLDQVKRANPKVNPNNLPVGREIKIPVPPDK